MDPSRNFHPVDIVLFALTLLISLVVGLYHGCQRKRQQTTKDFLLGGGELSAIPVAISMFMSYISAVLVLGNTAEMYTAGIQYWLACIGSSLAFLFASFVFVPLFFPLRFTSGNEYYEARFNSKIVRVWAAIMFVVSSVLYMGLTMFTPATALNAVTGFPVWGSILATGLLATIYTTLGGMKAVVWTDTIQGGIMVAGIIAVLIAGSLAVGGISKVWQISGEGGRLILFNFNPDPTVRLTFWSVIFGRFFISLNYVAGQTAIIRYSSLRTLKDARLTALLNIPAIILVYTLTCLCGLTVYAYYAVKGCDPIRNKEISSANQLLPYFIMEVVNYPGLPGVFLAVLFSGALSSISSSLNALSACAWKDLMEWKWHYIPESQKALINKILVAIFGAAAVGMAFVAAELGGHVLQATQSLVGGFGGPSLGLFFLGSFFPWSNWQGALFGSLTGFAMTAWVSMGAYITRAGGFDMLPTSTDNCPIPNTTLTTTVSYLTTTDLIYTSSVTTPPDTSHVLPIYKLSYMYNAGWGCLITIIVGIITSLITGEISAKTRPFSRDIQERPYPNQGRPKKNVAQSGPTDPKSLDSKLLVPVFDRLCCCLPTSWRARGHCGVEFDDVEDTKSKGDDTKDKAVISKTSTWKEEKGSNDGPQKLCNEKDNIHYIQRNYGLTNRGYESTDL